MESVVIVCCDLDGQLYTVANILNERVARPRIAFSYTFEMTSFVSTWLIRRPPCVPGLQLHYILPYIT